MNKPKPILILCNHHGSGADYYARNLASFNQQKMPDDHDWLWTYNICNLESLRIILRTHPRIDFDGRILPEFRDNPEKIEMLLAIQDHKCKIDPDLAVDFWRKAFYGTQVPPPSPPSVDDDELDYYVEVMEEEKDDASVEEQDALDDLFEGSHP